MSNQGSQEKKKGKGKSKGKERKPKPSAKSGDVDFDEDAMLNQTSQKDRMLIKMKIQRLILLKPC